MHPAVLLHRPPAPEDLRPVPKGFFLQPADLVARALLNCALVAVNRSGQICGGRIVETESYTQNDAASHSYKGPTARCASMFAEGGGIYVYAIYGVHRCLNVVCGGEGTGDAVLLRALEPYWGLAAMREMRTKNRAASQYQKYTDAQLCRGPGRLTAALGISLAQDGARFLQNFAPRGDDNIAAARDEKTPREGLYIMRLPTALHLREREVRISARIGIQKEKEKLARFYIADNIFVSGKAEKRSK